MTLWVATVVAGGEAWAPLAVAGVMVAETLPIMFLSLIAGVCADRWNRRRIMLTADAARCVLITGLAGVVLAEPVLSRAALLVVTGTVAALVSTANLFFSPARFGMLGVVVPDRDRERAASLVTATTALAGVVGPALGAVLMVAAGAEWAMVLNAGSFAVSFAALAMMRTGRDRPAAGATPERRPGMWREITEGFRYIAGNRTLKVVLLTTVAVSASTSCLGPLEVFFVTENLHGSPAVYGILGTVASVGALAGAALTALLAGRLRAAPVYAYSILASGVLLICYSRVTTPLAAFVVMFIAGLPLAALSAMTGPLLLRSTPERLLGRVSTAITPVTEITSMVSITAAGWLASGALRDLDVTVSGVHFGPIDTIFMVAGIGVAVAGFAAARAFRHAPDRPEQLLGRSNPA